MSANLLKQIQPLELNAETGEPFLRLPAPHTHIILTPSRSSDAEPTLPLMNDPRIYRWLTGPPYPYTLEHAEGWIAHVKSQTDVVWAELVNASSDAEAPPAIVSGSPVHSIREQKADGTEVFLGSCDLVRSPHEWVTDAEERARLVEENKARAAGDPKIIWSIGNYLAPTHYGQGIMTAVVRTLLHAWAIPRMGVQVMRPNAFVENVGSLRVFEKVGFVHWKRVEGCVEVRAKGEFPARTESLQVLEWPVA